MMGEAVCMIEDARLVFNCEVIQWAPKALQCFAVLDCLQCGTL
jgi:hypothetical protein